MDDLPDINPSDFGVLSFSHEFPSSAEVICRAKNYDIPFIQRKNIGNIMNNVMAIVFVLIGAYVGYCGFNLHTLWISLVGLAIFLWGVWTSGVLVR